MNRRQFLTAAAAVPVAAVAIAEAAPACQDVTFPGAEGCSLTTGETFWMGDDGFYVHKRVAHGYATERLSNPLLTPAEAGRMLHEGIQRDLEKYWRDAYDGKLVDEFGQPIPGLATEWANLYDDGP